MATARARDGIKIHYQVIGPTDAPPVLFVAGLGQDLVGWTLQRVAFGRHHRTIVFDNRGVGRSDKPVGPYSLEQMAADAVAVLDAAGVTSAHVVGLSMGGVIAQLLALRHPSRVRSLTLVCTACRHHPWRRQLLQEWARTADTSGMRTLTHEAMRWLVGPRSFRRFSAALGLVGPMAMSCPPHGFVAQVDALLNADASLSDLLTDVVAPTLVVAGNQDILTPRGDAEEIAELIPGAELVIISGAAHGLPLEHAATFNRIVTEFIARSEQNWRRLSDVA